MSQFLDDFKDIYLNRDNNTTGLGVHKSCLKSKNKNIVYLASKTHSRFMPSIYNTHLKEHNNLIEITKTLKEKGVSLAQVLDVFEFDDRIVEVQETAPGEMLYINFRQTGENIFNTNELDNKIFEYNLKMQQKLCAAPQEHFNKFVHDFITCTGEGIFVADSHSENIFYDSEKGFCFIDMPQNRKFGEHLPIDYITYMLRFFNGIYHIEAPCSHTDLQKYDHHNIKEIHLKHNATIYTKIIEALSKHNLLNNKESLNQLYFLTNKYVHYENIKSVADPILNALKLLK